MCDGGGASHTSTRAQPTQGARQRRTLLALGCRATTSKKKNWTHSYRVEKYVTLHVVHVIGLATVPGHAGGSGARAYHLGLTKHFPALAP